MSGRRGRRDHHHGHRHHHGHNHGNHHDDIVINNHCALPKKEEQKIPECIEPRCFLRYKRTANCVEEDPFLEIEQDINQAGAWHLFDKIFESPPIGKFSICSGSTKEEGDELHVYFGTKDPITDPSSVNHYTMIRFTTSNGKFEFGKYIGDLDIKFLKIICNNVQAIIKGKIDGGSPEILPEINNYSSPSFDSSGSVNSEDKAKAGIMISQFGVIGYSFYSSTTDCE